MNLRIRRRRFGQMALVSAATTLISSLANKTIAQSNDLLYGLSLTNKLLNKIDIRELANSTPEIALTAFNLVTGKQIFQVELSSRLVNNISLTTEIVNKAVFTEPRERLTGVTTLSNGNLIVSSVVFARNGNANRFIFIDLQSLRVTTALKFAGFPQKVSTVENILAFPNDKLLSIISLPGGIPPFDLQVIDLMTGKVTPGAELALPELALRKRFSNLIQAPNGKIYATNLDGEGVTSLIQLDLESKAIVTGRGKIIKLTTLHFEKKSLASDLLSLAFSRSGQLFALANLNSQKINSLYIINVETGEMQLLGQLPFDKIAFAIPGN